MENDILIFAEQRDGHIQKIAYELIGGARRLAAHMGGRIIAVLAGSHSQIHDSGQAEKLLTWGADEVYTIDAPCLAEYLCAPYTLALTEAVTAAAPSIVLLGSTCIGMDLSASLAGRLNTGLAADCTGLQLDSQSKILFMNRPSSDGSNIDVLYSPDYAPVIATVRPGVLSPLSIEETALRRGQGSITQLTAAFPDEAASECEPVKLLGVVRGEKKTADITEARVLVAGGRGIGGPEGFIPLRKVSELLGGGIACSRACVEAGWIDPSPQVGQTGKTVHPDLYLACGISGAFQHVTGMDDAKLIISINKNPAASIFDISDLGIVGNVENILPALISALEEYKRT